MTTRRLFEGEERYERRRGLLRRVIGLQGAGGVALVVLTVLPGVPVAFHIVAAAVLVAAVALALRVLRATAWEEDRRRHEAEAYVALAETMLIAVDRHLRVTMANPGACRVTGRSEPELIGNSVVDLLYADEDREAGRVAFDAIMAGEVNPVGYTSRRVLLRPDGGRRQVDWHVAPRYGPDGTLEGVLASGTDVTELLATEARLEQEARSRATLHGLTRRIASGEDARQEVVDRLAELLDAERAMLAEPEAGDWIVGHATDPELVGLRWPFGDQAAAVAGLQTCEVSIGSRRLGLLLASSAASDDDAALMHQVADEAALALRTLSDRAELERAALSDPLTGAANRRAFDRELAAAISRARRNSGDLCLVTMDLNHFKALNDQQGHEAGDRILVDCAAAWSDALRGGDLLARLGGDEFAAVLPDCAPEASQLIAERIRAATPHRGGSSVGVAQWGGESPDELSAQADQSLYADKAAGRCRALGDPRRLAAVAATGRWDAPRSPALDAIADRARSLLNLPVYVTLVGEARLVYAGLSDDAGETGRPLSHALCQLAVTTAKAVVIPDARRDPTIAAHPGVADGMVAYAGIPLTLADGEVLGALCAIDSDPHPWSEEELKIMHRAAGEVVGELVSHAGAA